MVVRKLNPFSVFIDKFRIPEVSVAVVGGANEIFKSMKSEDLGRLCVARNAGFTDEGGAITCLL